MSKGQTISNEELRMIGVRFTEHELTRMREHTHATTSAGAVAALCRKVLSRLRKKDGGGEVAK